MAQNIYFEVETASWGTICMSKLGGARVDKVPKKADIEVEKRGGGAPGCTKG